MSDIGDNSDLEVSYRELQDEVDILAGMQKSVSEATGKLRSEIKRIIDQKGYHGAAMAMIRQIDAMSETKRNDFLRTFEPMFEAMLSGKWRDQQKDLLAGVTGDED